MRYRLKIKQMWHLPENIYHNACLRYIFFLFQKVYLTQLYGLHINLKDILKKSIDSIRLVPIRHQHQRWHRYYWYLDQSAHVYSLFVRGYCSGWMCNTQNILTFNCLLRVQWHKAQYSGNMTNHWPYPCVLSSYIGGGKINSAPLQGQWCWSSHFREIGVTHDPPLSTPLWWSFRPTLK